MRLRLFTGMFFMLFMVACEPDSPEQPGADTTEDAEVIDTFSVKKPKPLTEAERMELAKNKPGVDSVISDASLIINQGGADTATKVQNAEAIVEHPDVAASFPGGEDAMEKYLSKKLVYPLVAFQNEIKGTVLLKVVIENDGRVGGIKVQRGLGYGCDESARDCVQAMPNWIPAKKGGVNVRSAVVIPLSFGQ